MADLILTGKVADKLRDLAERQGRTTEAVVEELIQRYPPAQEAEVSEKQEDEEAPPGAAAAFLKAALAADIHLEDTPPPTDPLVGLIGLLDEYTDATDLSSTVRETLNQRAIRD